jgi:sugar/nucleoside kinase (ribokinase family)
MAFPDPASAAGKADWRAILRKTLPYVDIFVPSLDEILFMLKEDAPAELSMAFLHNVAGELLSLGAKMVLLKLGGRGLYLRTAALENLQGFGRACPAELKEWAGFENWSPCYQVEVGGTTGAGDATIAGFLAGLLRGLSPGEALEAGLAVGACCVERPDALSGILPWEETWQRIHAGWPKLLSGVDI